MTVPDIIIIFIRIFDWTNKPQNIYIDIYFFVWVSCCTKKLFFWAILEVQNVSQDVRKMKAKNRRKWLVSVVN